MVIISVGHFKITFKDPIIIDMKRHLLNVSATTHNLWDLL